MTTHTCLRCGLDARCSHGTWPDQHPVAVAFIAVIALLIVATTPWLLIVLAAAALAYVVDREYRRRQALTVRADWEHKALMARPAHTTSWAASGREKVVRRGGPEDPGLMTLPTTPLPMGRT